jgi:HEPN domain-containing protein
MSDANELTRRWISYAQADLNAAETLLKGNNCFNQQICFLSQQAAEKAIKASLVFLQIEFPFIHDLDELRNLLPQDWNCSEQHLDLEILSDWAVRSRYPIDPAPPSLKEAQAAFQQAEAVLQSVQQDLENQGLSLSNKK